ncbi:MAG: M23 family metallopeptidase, partial [Bdellovibrionales bacterium]|nr:M23 family metallopeptidase [Bdellovibrionales bacterium]
MDKRKITFLVLSDRRGVSHRFVMSVGWVRFLGVMAVVGSMTLASMIVDYIGLLNQSADNKRLKAENSILRNQFSHVESKLEGFEAALTRVQTFTTKLKVITDTEDEDRLLKLAQSAKDASQNEEGVFGGADGERPPVSKLDKDDGLFFEKPPLESNVGEVAREKMKSYGSLSIRIDRNLKETSLKEQSILGLIEILSSRQSLLRSTPSIVPTRGWINSRFGYRVNPATGQAALHEGLDFHAAPGTPIHASADGVVSFAGWDDTYGRLVTIDHGYGVMTRYAHSQQLYVVVGQKVRRGDVISTLGSTGRSTGPHLHYEVRVNDVPVDPENYILDE